MLDQRLVSVLKKIRIHTKRIMQSSLSGDYTSAFKGSGLEFHQIREYQRGDDIRLIDWNSSAKMNKVMVKQYIEERDRSVIIVLDISKSGIYSSGTQSRIDQSKMLAATLALIAHENKDKIGLLTFSDVVQSWLKPAKNNTNLGKLLETIFKAEASGTTDIAQALKHLNSIKEKNAIVFFISDWIDSITSYEKLLPAACKRFDFIAIGINDPREKSMPNVGMLDLEDPETGTIFSMKTTENFSLSLKAHLIAVEKLFAKYKTDFLSLSTATPYEKALVAFFHTRTRR